MLKTGTITAMIILKLLTIILLTLFIWLVLQLLISGYKVFSFFKQGVRNAAAGPQTQRGHPGQTTMVKCAKCNLYVLDTDAVVRKGEYFCCADHAK